MQGNGKGQGYILLILTYNPDQQRITDFRLKPAMDTFMVVRYTVDKGEKAKGPDYKSDPARPGTMVCPLGESNPCFSLERAAS